MDETEIWRAAHDMIRDYGAGAEAQARIRAQKLQEHGILDDAKSWLRVADAIAELDRKKPQTDEPIN